MENKIKGKKLLILGATPNEIPVIKRAQELGAYVIVTDYNLNYAISPGKNVADECWDISWSDIDTLEKMCIKHRIDGVTAGFSEIRIDNLIQLCKRLGFPCYATEKQLEITRDKIKFKKECRKYGVPTIREYKTLEEVNSFPVIVKPTDRAGSIGIGIANNKEELEKAYAVAMEKSFSKNVIIEEYITNATEMDVHYVICDGEIELLTTDDIIQASGNVADKKVIQSAWMHPSKYHNRFLMKENEKMKAMIRGMGIKNGTIFFSGFVDSKGDFCFFECGFRMWGVQEFQYDFLKGNVNYLDIYIYHALTGTTLGVEKNRDKNLELKGIEVNMYVKGGVITTIKGLEKINSFRDCFVCIQDAYIGQECSFDNAILTKAALIGFANNNPEDLKTDVKNLYKEIRIEDAFGKNMLYDTIDVNKICSWWD